MKGEGNQQDYGMRIYDPRLGRFLSTDPLQQQYPELTPYQFASNTPIKAIDIDGLETSWRPAGQLAPRETDYKFGSQSTCQGCASRPQMAAMARTTPKPPPALPPYRRVTVSADNRTQYEKDVSAAYARQAEFVQRMKGATMDPLAGNIAYNTANTGSEYLLQVKDHATGLYEGIEDGNGWKIAGNTVGLALDFAPLYGMKGGSASTGTAYRAIPAEFAESTAKSGSFFKSGNAGRLGNDGIYANTTIEGAIAEFSYHNPGVTPAVFEVKYPAGTSLKINPPTGYFSQPLPFTKGVNILEAPSVRAPGTTNLLIREGAVPGKQIQ